MCGPDSAIGLDDHERELWPSLRERLREPGQLMAMMRGVLGGDAEVAAVTTVTPAGIVRPLALLVTPAIAAEIEVLDEDDPEGGTARARIGEDEVRVLIGTVGDGPPRPVAVLVTDWIREHLYLYARELWHRRR